MELKHLPVDWLIDEKLSLLQRIAKINEPIVHPQVGYRYPFALVRHLQERLEEVNRELYLRTLQYPRDSSAFAIKATPEQTADFIRAFK